MFAIFDLNTNSIAKHPRFDYELVFATNDMAVDMLDVFGNSPRYQVREI